MFERPRRSLSRWPGWAPVVQSPAKSLQNLKLGDLVEAELDRGLTLEERHEHDELAALGLDLADRTGQARERAFLDRDGLADFVVDLGGQDTLGGIARSAGLGDRSILD